MNKAKPFIQSYMLDCFAERCFPFLDTCIISSQNLNKIRRINKTIRHSNYLIFEVYVNRRIRRVDYSLGFFQRKDDRDAFSHLVRANGQNHFLRNMSAFTSEWCDSDSEIGSYVSDIWFEFDAGRRAPNFGMPAFFFGINNQTSQSEKKPPAKSTPFFETAQRVFSLLDLNMSLRALTNLENCYNTLSQYVGKMYTGIWFSRSSTSIRLVPMSFNHSTLPSMYVALTEAGWPGPVDAYESVWRELLHEKINLSPALDIGERISPDLKLELRFSERGFVNKKKLWQDFMEKTVSRDWCSPRKREGILKWHGGSRFGSPDKITALFLDREAKNLQMENHVLLRRINHAKLSFSPGRTTDVKIYLSANLVNRSECQDLEMQGQD